MTSESDLVPGLEGLLGPPGPGQSVGSTARFDRPFLDVTLIVFHVGVNHGVRIDPLETRHSALDGDQVLQVEHGGTVVRIGGKASQQQRDNRNESGEEPCFDRVGENVREEGRRGRRFQVLEFIRCEKNGHRFPFVSGNSWNTPLLEANVTSGPTGPEAALARGKAEPPPRYLLLTTVRTPKS